MLFINDYKEQVREVLIKRLASEIYIELRNQTTDAFLSEISAPPPCTTWVKS